MADKRISQLIERTDIANNDVLPIVASGATTTNKVTISTIQDWMQDNLDVGVTSVGLSVPSAFSVSGSPVTTSGNITISGAGTTAQYIRGDGSLADFPSISGGGSSVSYYLNGSVSQGTIGGVAYLEMNKVPVFGAGTDFTRSSNGYIASFITDAGDPALLEIPAGNWNFETYLQASSGGGSPTFYIELYKVNSGGTATLIASNSGTPEAISLGTNINPYFSALAVPTTSLTLTDRLAIRIYVTPVGRTITLHTENGHLCQIITTFTTGLTALNGLTAQVQNFATGTSGTDFNISSASTTHTFNLPDASASNRGAVTTGSQVFGGVKTFANGLSLPSAGGSNQVTRLVNIGTLHEGSATLNQIGFNSANNIYFGKGLSNGGVLQWTNAAVRYYTLPDADGTLALASQLGAYLPLTGGTLTGALGGTSLNFSGDIQTATRLISATGGQQILINANNGGSTNRIESVGTLPLALVSAAAITMAAGGTTPQITLATTGAVTLTGALNGTSAVFSGAVNDVISVSSTATTTAIKLNNTNANDWGSNIAFQSSSINKGFVGLVGSLVGNTDHSICLFGASGQSVKFFTNANTTPRLTLDSSTGAATFSSSVTARSSINLLHSNSTAIFKVEEFSGTQGAGLSLFNSSGTQNVLFNAGGDSFIRGGNVGIGTASPDAGLTIETTSTSFNALALRDARAYNASPEAALAFRVKFNSAGAFATPAILFAYKDNATDGNQAGGIAFLTNANAGPVERMRITSDAYLRMAASSGGIQFNGDTAAANALDDYEEGTWTPTNLSGGLTINLQRAAYTKIGNLVTIQFYADVPTGGNGDPIILGGLPFNNASNGWSTGATDISRCSKIGVIARVEGGGTQIQFLVSSGSTSAIRLELKGNEIGDSGYIIFTVQYRTS